MLLDVAAIALAAALGAVLAGRFDLAGAAVAVDAVFALFAFDLWAMARTFSRRS